MVQRVEGIFMSFIFYWLCVFVQWPAQEISACTFRKKSKKESLTSIYIRVWRQFSSLNNIDENIIQWSYTEVAVVAHIVTIIFYFFCFLHLCNCLRQFCTMLCLGLVIHFPVFFLLAPSFCPLVFPCARTKTESCVHQGLYHGSPENGWKRYWL